MASEYRGPIVASDPELLVFAFYQGGPYSVAGKTWMPFQYRHYTEGGAYGNKLGMFWRGADDKWVLSDWRPKTETLYGAYPDYGGDTYYTLSEKSPTDGTLKLNRFHFSTGS